LDKIQPTEHIKLNQKVKQTSFTCEIKKTVTNWNRKCFWTKMVYRYICTAARKVSKRHFFL